MIASKTKNEDVKTYFDVLDILETTIRMYKFSEDPALVTHIEYLNGFSERLKSKIETHDYTLDDERRKRVDIMLKKCLDT